MRSSVASVLLLVVVLAGWALVLRPQALGGPAGYVLVSGTSMEPKYHTGDMVLVSRQSRYQVGDVIAYRVPKGDVAAGAQVIHRIIGGDATHGFVVQGDNRSAPDVWRPKSEDIVGAKKLRIPNAVLVLQFLRSPLLLALLAACFVFVRVAARGSGEDAEVVELPGREDLKRAA
jgi:signal peptidase I